MVSIEYSVSGELFDKALMITKKIVGNFESHSQTVDEMAVLNLVCKILKDGK